MISYHLAKGLDGAHFARGFKVADTNDIERLKKAVVGWVWSPCVWRDGVRRQENFQRADWCVLDVDSPEMDLKEACERFCDMIHIIGTTKSHQKDKGGVVCDRYRVMLKFERPILRLDDYRYTMSRIVKRYPVDQQPKDGARFFYPCQEVIQSSDDGYGEEVIEAPEWFDRPGRKAERYSAAGTITPFARWALTAVVPKGERNTTWYRAGKDLAVAGYEERVAAAMIIDSKTYSGEVTPDLAREIEDCVRNGFKAALREMEADGRSEAR